MYQTAILPLNYLTIKLSAHSHLHLWTSLLHQSFRTVHQQTCARNQHPKSYMRNDLLFDASRWHVFSVNTLIGGILRIRSPITYTFVPTYTSSHFISTSFLSDKTQSCWTWTSSFRICSSLLYPKFLQLRVFKWLSGRDLNPHAQRHLFIRQGG